MKCMTSLRVSAETITCSSAWLGVGLGAGTAALTVAGCAIGCIGGRCRAACGCWRKAGASMPATAC